MTTAAHHLATNEQNHDVVNLMREIGQSARQAARIMATVSRAEKDLALEKAATALLAHSDEIISANAKDLETAKQAGRPASFIDRLKLDHKRIQAMADGLRAIAELDDPVGTVIAQWKRPNGMEISRVRTPLGVIGIIYESRPNVTADAGALCLKSGNAAILRGGSDSFHSSQAILDCLQQGLLEADLPKTAITLVPTTDRAAVGEMLKGLDGTIDVLVPRGGKSLVERVQKEARVPVFSHLEGVCHTYVDRGADIDIAKDLVINAKLRRTGICGATETVLVDKGAHEDNLKPVIKALLDAGCEVRGDEAALKIDPRVKPASESDWGKEYLDSIVSVKAVDGIDEAIEHIAHYGSGHTDCIVTECYGTADRFLNRVDSAVVMHNVSTQFSDGGEFGMGAEIGIATGKMHARGPVGVEQLTSFKYVVRGTGQVRPD